MKYCVIIPAYNPSYKFISLINELVSNKIDKIIVVDDGSKEKSIFKKIKNKEGVTILTHDENKGKGIALKTAFKYYLDNFKDSYDGVITTDCDYQHKVNDIINVLKEGNSKNLFTMGVRSFNKKIVPFRRKLGNKITSFIFKKKFNIYLKDTQTGLRYIPNRLIYRFLNLSGNRYEYEINMLIDLAVNDDKIIEIPIETIYLKGKENHSFFNPFRDSYLIIKEILKYKNS